VDLTYPPVQQPELSGISRERLKLHEVFIVYRRQFWKWFGITAPTSLLAAAVLWVTDQKVRTIFGSIPWADPSYFAYHLADWAEAILLRLGGWFAAWFLGAFALGAIATGVGNLDSDENGPWRRDSHQRSREHFGGIFLIALFTFFVFALGNVAQDLVISAVVKEVGWKHFARYNQFVSLAGYVVIASIVSWFGAAIPMLLRGNTSAVASLRKSYKQSNGCESFLFMLVIESVVGSCIAWYAVYYGLPLVVPAQFRYTAWYAWGAYLAFILASSAVQPPMFIGFSLLADEGRRISAVFPSSQQPANIH
jgi:hypothetical protein